MTDAELIARLMTIADTQERIENSEDRWKNPPYLPRAERDILRAAAVRLLDFADMHRVILKGVAPASNGTKQKAPGGSNV